MVVFDSENDLGCTIVPALYVEEATCAVLATGAKIYQLYLVELVVCKQDILRFHVAVDYSFVFHEF